MCVAGIDINGLLTSQVQPEVYQGDETLEFLKFWRHLLVQGVDQINWFREMSQVQGIGQLRKEVAKLLFHTSTNQRGSDALPHEGMPARV